MTPLEQDLITLDSGLLILSTGTAWTDNDEIYDTTTTTPVGSAGKFYLLGKA